MATHIFTSETLTMLREIEAKLGGLLPEYEPVPSGGEEIEQIHAIILGVYKIVASIEPKTLDKVKSLLSNPLFTKVLGANFV